MKTHTPPFVGMPALLKLDEFGSMVRGAFGATPILVGSSMTRKTWRDVDVRLVLSDTAWCKLFDQKPEEYDPSKYVEGADMVEVAARDHWNSGIHFDERWVSLVLAFSALGKEMTGLPIDFQIQPECVAKVQYPKKEHKSYRLGFTPLRVRCDRAETQ